MAPPRPKKKNKDAATIRLVRHNVRTLIDVLGQERILAAMAKALAAVFKGDPPAGSAAVTFGSGTTITVVVGVEPDQPNRHDYAVTVEQLPDTAETEIASATAQPSGDQLGSSFTSYVRARALKVRLSYTDDGVNPPDKQFEITFPASPQPGLVTLALIEV